MFPTNTVEVLASTLAPTLALVVAKNVAVLTRPVMLIAAALTSVELAVKDVATVSVPFKFVAVAGSV